MRVPDVRPRTLGLAILVVVAVAAVLAIVLFRVGPGRTGSPSSQTAEATPTLAASFPAQGQPRLRNPLGIAVAGGRVYVAESDAGVVRVFGTNGAAVASLTVPAASGVPAAYPADVAVLPDGRLAVLDTAGERVVLLRAEDGNLLGTVGSAEGTAALKRPTAVAADGRRIYVADAAARDVKVYGLDGRLQRVLGASLRPSLTTVGGMAPVGGRLWLSDSNAGRVVAIDATSGAQELVLPVRFSLPRGLAAGPAQSLLVADVFGRKVFSFDAAGRAGFELSSPGAGGQPASPRDVAYSREDARLYVIDAGSGTVFVYVFSSRK